MYVSSFIYGNYIYGNYKEVVLEINVYDIYQVMVQQSKMNIFDFCKEGITTKHINLSVYSCLITTEVIQTY
jgi:hypothetical protein